MLKQILLVALGGGAGSVLRYLSTELTHKYYSMSFPLATFIVNMVGCFCIGMLVNLIPAQSTSLRYLLIIGFCGGFTTFSTFARETLDLMQADQLLHAFLYTIASCVIGISFVWLGLLLTMKS